MAIEFKEYSEEEKQQFDVGQFTGCDKCVYFPKEFDEICGNSPCTSDEREDKKDGYYIKTEN
jgi:hypothetical protein